MASGSLLSRSARTLTSGALMLLVGCTAVLDSGRHRGGEPTGDGGGTDAGPGDGGRADGGDLGDGGDPGDGGPPDAGCDQDGDGFRAIECGGDDCDDTDPDVYPNAPPICGNGRVEACPGSDVPGSHFDAASAGLLRPVSLRAEGAHGMELALGGVVSGGGGFGTAVVIFAEDGGAGRLDVPLNRLGDAAFMPVVDSEDAPLANVRAVAVSQNGDNELAAAFTGVDEFWLQEIDFAAGDGAVFRRAAEGLQVPAIVDGNAFIYRTSIAGQRRIELGVFGAGPPLQLSYDGPEVPEGRARTTPFDNWVAMQPAGSDVSIWERGFDRMVTTVGFSVTEGFIAIGPSAGSTSHWAAAPILEGAVNVANVQCDGTSCTEIILGGGGVQVRTGADRVDATDVLMLPSDARLALFIEHRADRDTLTMQPIASDGRIAHPRFELFGHPQLDTSSLRLLDARMRRVETALGTTVFVAALVGTTEGTEILATGVRTCVMD